VYVAVACIVNSPIAHHSILTVLGRLMVTFRS
jgi:hypothetical protein